MVDERKKDMKELKGKIYAIYGISMFMKALIHSFLGNLFN